MYAAQQIINEYCQKVSEKRNAYFQKKHDSENEESCKVKDWLTKAVSEKFDNIGGEMVGSEKYDLILQKEEIDYKIWKIDKGLN